jgi:hypothetical protein
MKHWEDFGFKVELTADQSPTLRLLQSSSEQHQDGESMHHSGGAWSETQQIYGRAIDEVYQKWQANPVKIQFVVVGLGLGYIELLIAQMAEKYRYPLELIQIDSFESVPELKNYFINWVKNEDLACEISNIYNEVAKFVGENCKINLQSIFQYGQLQIHSTLNQESMVQLQTNIDYSGLMYDAFSSKTNPELWHEEFLKSLMALHHSEFAVVATYASKGTLKRALKYHNFISNEEKGFQGKRNSTFAVWSKK